MDGQELREGFEVLTEPGGELPSVDAAGRQIQHDAFLFIKAGVNLCAVQHEERLRRGMADALVPSTKGWFPTSEKQSAAAFSTSVG